MNPAVVMKFGGTSVGNAAAMERTAKHVARAEAPFVVISAVGGVTDLLLRAGEFAREGFDFTAPLDEIRSKHAQITAELQIECAETDDLLEQLSELLKGISLVGELSDRVQDKLVSFGERMSIGLLAATLRKMGHNAASYPAWELGMRTTDRHTNARPLPDVDGWIRNAVRALPQDQIPIVTGFMGHTQQGHIATLGRGGSDYSAAIFGAALAVEEIQIWTDVPGILRADPRVVDGAEIARQVRFDEAAELAYFGAKVLHPRTIEPARRASIPVRVLSTFALDPDGDLAATAVGTVIDDSAVPEAIRAIAVQRGVRTLHVHSLGMLDAPGFLAKVFAILAEHQVSVDVIATSEVSVSMTFDRCDGDLSAAIAEVSEFATVSSDDDRTIVCLVGAGLRGNPRLRARIFDALADEDIPVHVISQGASRINLTLVIDKEHSETAMRALHSKLFTGE